MGFLSCILATATLKLPELVVAVHIFPSHLHLRYIPAGKPNIWATNLILLAIATLNLPKLAVSGHEFPYHLHNYHFLQVEKVIALARCHTVQPIVGLQFENQLSLLLLSMYLRHCRILQIGKPIALARCRIVQPSIWATNLILWQY